MNEEIKEKTETLQPFTRLCMTIGQLPSSYVESMSYYEQLIWFTKYLQEQVIPAVNQNAAAVEELQGYFLELQEYVNNYFDNLDVQEEINNKLDEMAQDGSLLAIIKNYVDPIYENFETQINAEINGQNQEITTFKNYVNGEIDEMNIKVNNSIGISPIAVSSTDDMTDNTKIYVLTTDGYWYYYNGTAFVQGGEYQSSGISDDSIDVYQTKLFDYVGLLPKTNWTTGQFINNETGVVTSYSQGSYNQRYVSIDNTKHLICFVANNLQIAFYDNTKTFISGQGLTNHSIIEIPNTAYYCRFSRIGNPLVTLPDNYPQIQYVEDYLQSQLVYTKLKEKYNYLTFSNIYGFQKLIYFYPYGNTTLTKNENTYNITSAGITGPCFIHKLAIGDKIHISQKVTSGTINSTATLYTISNNENVQVYTCTLDENRKGIIEITQSIYNQINGNIIFIVCGTSGSVNYDLTIYEENEYFNLNEFVKRYNNKVKEIDSKLTSNSYKAIFLGDSITAMSGPQGQYDVGWIYYFKNKIQLSQLTNIAQNGAWLQDKTDTTDYTGELVGGDDPQNVLGNQVQYLLNSNIDEPDFIIIAIGTNSGITTSSSDEIYSMYYNNGSTVALSDVDRKKSAGAFRWCLEKLHNKYPNALIFWSAPIHKGGDNYKNVVTWYNNLKQFCEAAGVECIDSLNCGIQCNGAGNYTEFLHDNLHTNEKGAEYLGNYIANYVKSKI